MSQERVKSCWNSGISTGKMRILVGRGAAGVGKGGRRELILPQTKGEFSCWALSVGTFIPGHQGMTQSWWGWTKPQQILNQIPNIPQSRTPQGFYFRENFLPGTGRAGKCQWATRDGPRNPK